MTRQAFERGDWQTMIVAHGLEINHLAECMGCESCFAAKADPGADGDLPLHQGPLAFVNARKQEASVSAAAQKTAVLLCLG
jgi:hypothetical protein